MKTKLAQEKTFFSNPVVVAPSKICTYPTRLADAWQAGVMEICLPEEDLDYHEIKVNFRQESTQSLGIKSNNLYKRIYKKLSVPIQVDDEYVFDARYETDANMAHILVNVIPQLLVSRKVCPGNLKVILRANASAMGRNTYNLLGFPVLCTDREVYGNLVLAPDNFSPHFRYLGLLKSLFKDLVFEGYNKQTPERVFISRKGTRCLLNETEVEQTLQKFGFEKFYFEDIPISHQWSIVRNAKVVVALHGAALASLVFNQNSAKVVELCHPGYVVRFFRPLTNAIGGTWCGVTGQITSNVIKELDFKHKGRAFALSPTKIDIASLRMALNYLGISEK